MMVVPEGGSLLQHNLTMVVDGHTTIEHSIPFANIYDDIRQLWSQSDVAYTPRWAWRMAVSGGELLVR